MRMVQAKDDVRSYKGRKDKIRDERLDKGC